MTVKELKRGIELAFMAETQEGVDLLIEFLNDFGKEFVPKFNQGIFDNYVKNKQINYDNSCKKK